MTNFERMKSLDSEYKMTDLIMYVLSTRYSEIIKGGGEINGLPFLRWLQEEAREGWEDEERNGKNVIIAMD